MRSLASFHPLLSLRLRGPAVVVAAATTLMLSACGEEQEPTARTAERGVPGSSTPVSGTSTTPRVGLDGGTRGAFGTSLTTEQLATFERANVKLINLTNATDADLDRRVHQAKAACDRLDPSVPMLQAFAARCAPTIQLGRQTNVLGARCGEGAGEGQCGRILRRVADTFDEVASTGRAFKLEAKALTDDRACLKRLVPSAEAYRSLRSGATLARKAATAIDAGDDATFQAAIVDFQRVAVKGIDESGPAQPIVDNLRAACGLVKTASPPGERED